MIVEDTQRRWRWRMLEEVEDVQGRGAWWW